MLQAATLIVSHQKFPSWTIVGIAFGIYGFARGFRLLRRKRSILNAPASKIGTASMGLVEISGIATGPHVVVSPLKQVECFYCRSVAWKLKPRGKTGRWVKVADEALQVPFYVDDNTDKLLIDPTGAEMDLRCDFHEEYENSGSENGEERPASVDAFLARHGATPTGKIKVEEYCIRPDNFLFVLGTLSQNPGLDVSVTPAWAIRAGQSTKIPPQSESTPLQEVIRLSAGGGAVPAAQMTQQQKIAAALAKAGAGASMPWASGEPKIPARTARFPKRAAATAEKRVLFDPAGFDLHPSVVLMKGSSEPSFFISWRSQRDVVNSVSWKSALALWGSAALLLASAYFLVLDFR
jgi:E3 ubiquitin ligase